MKYLRALRLNFSTSWTWNTMEFSSWSFPLRGHEVSYNSPVKLFHFVDVKYDRVPKLKFSTSWTWNIVRFSSQTFLLRGHEILSSSPIKLFHFMDMKYLRVLFVDMKYRTVLQLNFSTSWTWNIVEFSSSTFPLCEHEIW